MKKKKEKIQYLELDNHGGSGPSLFKEKRSDTKIKTWANEETLLQKKLFPCNVSRTWLKLGTLCEKHSLL